MKRRSYLLALFALVLATGFLVFRLNRSSVPRSEGADPGAPGPLAPVEVSSPESVPPPVAEASPDASIAPVGTERPRLPGKPLRIPAGQPIPELFPFQKEREAIQALASTYDAGSIPALAAFLDHADPMVRDEARLGLIQLSRPEAVPVLRAAAAKSKNVEEAAALREAADFLAPVGSG